MVPQGDVDNVTNNLLNDIVSANDNHLTTGILGTKYLMIGLSEIGRTDIALDLVFNFLIF